MKSKINSLLRAKGNVVTTYNLLTIYIYKIKKKTDNQEYREAKDQS